MKIKSFPKKDVNINSTTFSHIINLPEEDAKSFETRDQVVDLLKFWSRTGYNNLNTCNLISFEKLIYFELEYKNDQEIQQLIEILKERIALYYNLKTKWLDVLVDKDIYDNIPILRYKRATHLGLYTDKAQEVFEWNA